jgi:signal peptidase
MEIDTSPRPPAPTRWGRLALSVVLLGPVTLFVLLPIGLGLEHYVITGDTMDGDRPGSMARGSLAFERVVPVSDLRVGDVITFPPPGDPQSLVTHRIVAIGPDGILTQGDAEPTRDRWTLRPEGTTLPRVVYVVPYVGWAYIARPSGWVFVVAGLVLAALSAQRVRRRTPVLRPAPTSSGEVDATLMTGLNHE